MTVGVLGGPCFTQVPSIHPQPAVQYAALGAALETEQLSEKRSQGQETGSMGVAVLLLALMPSSSCWSAA